MVLDSVLADAKGIRDIFVRLSIDDCTNHLSLATRQPESRGSAFGRSGGVNTHFRSCLLANVGWSETDGCILDDRHPLTHLVHEMRDYRAANPKFTRKDRRNALAKQFG